MQDESILRMIYANDNDQLSQMNSVDKKELLDRLRKYSLTLRDNLNLKKNATFGLELEFKHKNGDSHYNISDLLYYNFLDDWNLKEELTIIDGGEITTPISTDSTEFWKKLDFVCEELQKYATTNRKCGGHIHIGQQVLGSRKRSLHNFFELWSAYEPIIYRFGTGDSPEIRECVTRWARPVSPTWSQKLKARDINHISKYEMLHRFRSDSLFPGVKLINFEFQRIPRVKEYNTIEFRSPNGTLDSVILQNNVNLFMNILTTAKSNKFDRELLERVKEKTVLFNGKLAQYNKVHIDEALTFADMVFDNNLDKIYFLKQYVKENDKGKSIVLKK